MEKAFTIVELIIVIAIVALLALLALTGYYNVQAKARMAKSRHDVAVLSRAVATARVNKGKTLAEITGETYTVGPCVGTGIVPSTLNKATHPCWTQYRHALDAIGAAAGTNLLSFYEGTQYGHPYYIDENEVEDENDPCRRDVVADRGQDFAQTSGDEVTYDLLWYIDGCN